MVFVVVGQCWPGLFELSQLLVLAHISDEHNPMLLAYLVGRANLIEFLKISVEKGATLAQGSLRREGSPLNNPPNLLIIHIGLFSDTRDRAPLRVEQLAETPA